MPTITKKQLEQYRKLQNAKMLSPDGLRFICESNHHDPEAIGWHFLEVLPTLSTPLPSMPTDPSTYIASTVHSEYYDLDTNCAGVTLKCLSHLFSYPIAPQSFAASLGMHGAGGYRAQCGLIEGALMFLGMYLTALDWERTDVSKACYEYATAFEKEFGALTCRNLRPQGLAEGQPPHMCETLTVRAVQFAYDYVRHLVEQKQQ